MDLSCGNCGAALKIDSNVRTVKCPYCAVAAIVERPPTPGAPNPNYVVPFSLPEARAREAVGRWLRSCGLFVRSEVKRASISSMRGVYVPAYLYSAISFANYRAEIGENYQEQETYTTTDSNGKSVTRVRNVTRTEWRSLSGQHANYLLDILVTASRGIPNHELEAAEPFDFRDLRRYSPALLSGWIAEEATLTAAQGIELARTEARATVHHQLQGFMPGDSYRDLRFDMRLDRETLDYLLVPLWVIAAKWHPTKPPLHILVNGQTGLVTGKPPISWVKVTLAILAGLALVAGIVLAVMHANSGRH